MPISPDTVSAGRTPPGKYGIGARQAPVTKTSAEIQSELDAEAEAEAKRRRIQVSPLILAIASMYSRDSVVQHVTESLKLTSREHAISVDGKRFDVKVL
jgi:Ribonuclease G/E